MCKLILCGNANSGKTTIFNHLTKQHLKTGNWLGVSTQVFESEALLSQMNLPIRNNENQENITTVANPVFSKAIKELEETKKQKEKSLKNTYSLASDKPQATKPLKSTYDSLLKVEKSDYENKYVIADLPGIYSLSPVSEDEKVACMYLESNKDSVILNIADIFNLKRSLYLTLKLLEKGFKTVLVLNFSKNFKGTLNIKELQKRLGIPIIIFNKTTFKKDLILELKNASDFRYTSPATITSTSCAQTYKKIDSLLLGIYETKLNRPYGFSKLDKIILNKFLAVPIFACIMLLIFYLAFGLVGNLIAGIMESLSNVMFNLLTIFFKFIYLPESIILAFNEVIASGITSVIQFGGQIFIVLLCLNVLEHSGYISRLAFVFDDFFELIGLSGKGIFTLILGLGCATSAIPFSRVIEDKNSKIKTSILTPLLPCTAKLPVCALVCASFFPTFTFLTMFLVYFISVLVVILFAIVLNFGKLKTKKQNHILEFPSYKLIAPSEILKTTLTNLKSFMGRILTFAICINIVIFLLSSITLNLGENKTSVFFVITNALSVIFKPLGFNNPIITSSLVSGLMAKELIVSSLSPFLTHGNLTGLLNINQALSFLVFSLFFSPCFSSLHVLKDEFNIKTALFTFITQFAFAYSLSFVVYNCLILNFTLMLVIVSILISTLIIIFLIKSHKTHRCANCHICNKSTCKL